MNERGPVTRRQEPQCSAVFQVAPGQAANIYVERQPERIIYQLMNRKHSSMGARRGLRCRIARVEGTHFQMMSLCGL
jgi:hypothetical protein